MLRNLKRIYDEFPSSECDPKEMFKRHVSSHDSDKIFNEIAGTIKFNHVFFLNFIKDWAKSPQNIDTAKTISIEIIKSKIDFADTDQDIMDNWMSFVHDVKDHSVFQGSDISRNKNIYITIVNYFKENIQNPELFKKSDLTLYAFMKLDSENRQKFHHNSRSSVGSGSSFGSPQVETPYKPAVQIENGFDDNSDCIPLMLEDGHQSDKARNSSNQNKAYNVVKYWSGLFHRGSDDDNASTDSDDRKSYVSLESNNGKQKIPVSGMYLSPNYSSIIAVMCFGLTAFWFYFNKES